MSRRIRFRDPRVLLGLAITVFFLWLALRDAPFSMVGAVLARANWPLLLGLSIPSYLGAVILRARRWRHLTATLQDIETGPLFRGVAVGFMVNNVLPLRVGEVARVWYLARETGVGFAPILGTVILERVIDTLTVILMAIVAVAWWGAGGGGWIEPALLLLVPALILSVFVVALTLAPDRVVALATALLSPFPERFGALVGQLLRQVGDGLGSLRSGRRLLWIGLDSLWIWVVFSTLPMLAGLWALDVELDPPGSTVMAAWTLLVAVAIGVALPSAPGFFGPYHFAAKEALQLFGVPAGTAVAVGTLVHAVFWVTLTSLGLAVLRLRRTSLSELQAAASAPPARGPGKADPTESR